MSLPNGSLLKGNYKTQYNLIQQCVVMDVK